MMPLWPSTRKIGPPTFMYQRPPTSATPQPSDVTRENVSRIRIFGSPGCPPVGEFVQVSASAHRHSGPIRRGPPPARLLLPRAIVLRIPQIIQRKTDFRECKDPCSAATPNAVIPACNYQRRASVSCVGGVAKQPPCLFR